MVKKVIISLTLLIFSLATWAQCSVCTRTAQQLGEEPAKGLNAGILYLAALPLTIIGVVYYQWRKRKS